MSANGCDPKNARAALIGLALVAWTSTTHATVITLDFNGPGAGTFQYDPYYEKGFEVTSLLVETATGFYQAHYDRECGIATTSPDACGVTSPLTGDYDGTPFLASEYGSSRFFDPDGNFLLAACCAMPRIRIDAFGALFTPLDFLNVRSGYSLTSSKGGSFADYLPIGTLVSLSGDLWTDIAWIDLTVAPDIVSRCPGVPCGIDNLRMKVPEPSPLSMVPAIVIGIILSRRRSATKP